MAEIVVVAAFRAEPGKEKELEAELMTAVELTHQEPGCLKYVLHKNVEKPGCYALVERWVSREALDRHFDTEHLKRLEGRLPELLIAPAEIDIYQGMAAGNEVKGRL